MSQPTLDENDAAKHETLSKQIMDSIQGKDAPMEESHPEEPPLLALASYPLVLILGIVVILFTLWLAQS